MKMFANYTYEYIYALQQSLKFDLNPCILKTEYKILFKQRTMEHIL